MSNTIPIKKDKRFCNIGYSEFADAYISLFEGKKVNWKLITDGIPIEVVLEHPEIKWNWYTLSRHKHVKLDFILSHLELPWDWNYVCQNPNLTLQIIIDNPDKPWNCKQLSKNSSITPQIIAHFPNGGWNWEYISENMNIKYIIEQPDLPIKWKYMHRNKTITTKFIENNINKRWNWGSLSMKRELTFELALKYPNKTWNWDTVCKWNLKRMEAKHAKHCITWINLVAIHKYFNQPVVMKMDTTFKPVELVLMDVYMTKIILQY